LATRPRYSTTVYVTGTSYYYWGGVYYASSGSGYVVVAAPPGAVVYAVPPATTVVYAGRYAGSRSYYYYGGTYYLATREPAQKPPPQAVSGATAGTSSAGQTKDAIGEEAPHMTETGDGTNYKVVEAPINAIVPYLPEEAKEETIKGKKYFHYQEAYYQRVSSEGKTMYMVVAAPK